MYCSRKKISKILICLYTLFYFNIFNLKVFADSSSEVVSLSNDFIKAKSAILMEQSTGQIFYELNKDEKLQIASVTKIMTILLALESLKNEKIHEEDIVSVSEYASTMGGSQVYLEPNEKISVKDLMKSIIVSSGNDAAVAIAEHISGSEPAFIDLMNKRAQEIGAKNTHFINCNGLDETDEHFSTAYDVAKITQEILKYEKVFEYTKIWTDTIRDGKFGLSNTNKLLKSYSGTTGLKTGSTAIAGFCISATANRDNMHLIAIIIGSPTSKDRFESASKLFDYGFSNFAIIDPSKSFEDLEPIKISKAMVNSVKIETASGTTFVIKKGDKGKITKNIQINNNISAPILKNEKLGYIVIKLNDEEIARCDIISSENVDRINFFRMLSIITNCWLKMDNSYIIKG